jgi:isoleucyl-tRNA synthetase
MAPILSFTAEESWKLFAKGERSVFEETWHRIPAAELNQSLLDHWANVRRFRETVTKRIEEQREQKLVGSSLAAEVDIQAHGPLFDSLVHLGDELRYVLITSRASVHRSEGPVAVDVEPSAHSKCDRCWHYRSDVNDAGLCARCESNMRGPGEPRLYA